jgi:excisionase family DNA binding protein
VVNLDRSLRYGEIRLEMTKEKAMAEANRQFIGLAELAERTGVSLITIRRRIAAGEVPVYQSGQDKRRYLVSVDEVDRLATPERVDVRRRDGLAKATG